MITSNILGTSVFQLGEWHMSSQARSHAAPLLAFGDFVLRGRDRNILGPRKSSASVNTLGMLFRHCLA